MDAKGFSLVELVTVLVIIGVLAVVALPRLQTDAFDAGARAEQLATDARYAQSLAMTRADPHGIEITATGWRIVDSGGNTVRTADGRLAGSFGDLGVSGFTGTILFGNVFGNPDIASDASLTLSAGGSSTTVVINALSGYVDVS